MSKQDLSAQGSRRLTLSMLAIREQADKFEGLPRSMAKPLRFLAAFQEAEPYLRLPTQAFKLIAWLVKMTQAQDWETGSRPIAWPSAARQAEFLGLTRNAVKTLNRLLFEAGVFVMRDSPTGKRYGRRDGEGRILEAYGFDLSPLAIRYEEFIRLAAMARIERERMQVLKRRATCARRAIAQIGEALGAIAPLPSPWSQLVAETAELVAAIRQAKNSTDLAVIVQALEERQGQAESLAAQLSSRSKDTPVGPEKWPHIISTNRIPNPSDTVMAFEKSSRRGGNPEHEAAGLRSEPGAQAETMAARAADPAKVHPGELLQLAPRLRDHVPQPFPDWSDVVNAAGEGLRIELGVSPSLWSQACLAVGRKHAAVALAVVSTKPANHFTRGAGGYFAAMINRAKRGELHLDRSLWKLRRDQLENQSRVHRTLRS